MVATARHATASCGIIGAWNSERRRDALATNSDDGCETEPPREGRFFLCYTPPMLLLLLILLHLLNVPAPLKMCGAAPFAAQDMRPVRVTDKPPRRPSGYG